MTATTIIRIHTSAVVTARQTHTLVTVLGAMDSDILMDKAGSHRTIQSAY